MSVYVEIAIYTSIAIAVFNLIILWLMIHERKREDLKAIAAAKAIADTKKNMKNAKQKQ